ncbi:anaphase-promoting complex subunit 6-like [Rhododendron vialii]|uniref:anaphase-promoting complex subunit 6-like n=1 Tax=Rhododendron vialii TaxID=182163 RepID=UPI00265D8F57|nr:anaphase-promoting complex subunit 6-like [Rhododendron vialii]
MRYRKQSNNNQSPRVLGFHQSSFFMQAKTICPSDPHVYNKLGVVAHHMKEYKKAVRWFEKTLAHIPSSLSEMWEPTVVNLAHSLRKLKRYHEAITYYEKALALSTGSLSTYAGLAYTYICRIILLQQLPTITRFYG